HMSDKPSSAPDPNHAATLPDTPAIATSRRASWFGGCLGAFLGCLAGGAVGALIPVGIAVLPEHGADKFGGNAMAVLAVVYTAPLGAIIGIPLGAALGHGLASRRRPS